MNVAGVFPGNFRHVNPCRIMNIVTPLQAHIGNHNRYRGRQKIRHALFAVSIAVCS